MRLKKKNFNTGSPYSSWLKEELIGEVCDSVNGFECRGLVEKYGLHFDESTVDVIMGISKLDDLPDDLKKIAVDIIRMELDENFQA